MLGRRLGSSAALSWAGIVLLVAGACAPKFGEEPPAETCISTVPEQKAGATGRAYSFPSDPMTSSGNPNLSPVSNQLDSFKTEVQLQNLGGRGLLEGSYVEVRDGLTCKGGFHAYDESQSFLYSYGDTRFQEAMVYSQGDRYRARLAGAGALLPAEPVMIVAHCMEEDNAYFIRAQDRSGAWIKEVCLGDSVSTPGASYSDDANVVIHELQHANTVDTYHPTEELNRLWYDEAGALNEAVSDFFSLAHLAETVSSPFDPKLFSRWALGVFIPGYVGVRGAHRCPQYDPSYPSCGGFDSAPSQGVSAAANRVSFAYPDGLGWPYANNYSSPGFLRSAFFSSRSQEQIHNNGTILSGALFEVFEAFRANRGGDSDSAFGAAARLVSEAIRNLPKPTSTDLAPVSFREYASQLVSAAETLGYSAADKNALNSVLTERGLIGGTTLAAGWASVGSGLTGTPGVRILDNSVKLKTWLAQMGGNPAVVPSTLRINNKLDPGETVAIWFDLRNLAARSAGGILLTVTVDDADVRLLDGTANIGALLPSASFPNRTQAQVVYSKVNGTEVVTALSSSNPSLNVPTGNSYFYTNPWFDASYTTAVWLKARPETPSGKVVSLSVRLRPSNGVEETLTFPVTIP
jgi:hypothetical protein